MIQNRLSKMNMKQIQYKINNNKLAIYKNINQIFWNKKILGQSIFIYLFMMKKNNYSNKSLKKVLKKII